MSVKSIPILVILLLCISFNIVYGANVYGVEIEWNPGILEGIPRGLSQVNVIDYGAKGDGVNDDAPAFIKAIESSKNGGAVYIPEGNYLLKSKITISKSVILIGEGTEKTNLLVDHSSDAFEMVIYKRGTWVNLLDGYNRGSKELVVEDATAFAPGKYVEIQQDNNPTIMYTLEEWNQDWAQGSIGQISKINSIMGNKIYIEDPLQIDYSKNMNPVIRTQGFVENVGFENFTITRVDKSDTNIFYFKNSANCWIRNVHSKFASKAHVSATTAYRLEIRDSFFDDATSWKGGGHGYGVELGYHVTNCLVENNIFKHLRHSMMVQLGANGNVFGYNYSIEPYQNEGGNWAPCDISVHGHYACANLFEGNIIQEITISDYWGPSGPYNTFLRNRIESENIAIEDSSNYQIITGNEFVKGKIVWDTDSRYPHLIDISTMIFHGNYINGFVAWDNSIEQVKIPASYYLKEKPVFYGDTKWPSVGSDMVNGTNPAQLRFKGDTPLSGIIRGDVNGDGEVDSTDFAVMKRYLLQVINDFPCEQGKLTADVNRDGNIDSTDFALLKRYILGIIKEF